MKTRIPLLILSALGLCQFLPAIQTTKPQVLIDINQTSRAPQDSFPKGLLARPDATWQTKRFQKVGNVVFFQAKTAATGAELYYCTSKAGSAKLAVDISKGTGSSNPTEFMEFGGKLYFKATDGSSGYQVYEASVGTTGVTALKLTAFTNTSTPDQIGALIGVDKYLYFTAKDAVTSNYHIHRLDLATRNSYRYPTALMWHWIGPVQRGQNIVFEGHDSQGQEAWWLEGDKIGYIRNYSGTANGRCVDPIELGGLVYFSAFDGKWGIWKWGPKLGTQKVMDLTLKYGWTQPVVLGKRLIFNGGTGEPFSVDPAAAAPKVLSLPASNNEGGRRTPIVFGNKLYYYGYSSTQTYAGNYLFETDGLTSRSIPGTRAHQGGPGVWIAPVVIPATKPYLLFGFRSGTTGDSLYKFDGTTFQRLLEINWSLYTNSGTGMLTELDGKVVFAADDGRYGSEFWLSDGTGAGTILHTNIAVETRTSDSSPRNFVRLGRRLYFTAHDGQHGVELWSTDGKPNQEGPNGTAMVVDLNPGTGSSDPKLLKASEAMGKLFMNANDGSGQAVFVFDPLTWKSIRISGTAIPDLSTAWVHPGTGLLYALAKDSKTSIGSEPHVYNPITNTFLLLGDTNPGAGDGQFNTPIALGTDGSLAWRSYGNLFDSAGTPGKTRQITHTGVTYIGENIAVNDKIVWVGMSSQGMPGAYALDAKTHKVQQFQSATKKYDAVLRDPFVVGGRLYYLATIGSSLYLFAWDGNSTSGKQISNTAFQGLERVYNMTEQAIVTGIALGLDEASIVFGLTLGGVQAWKVDSNGASQIGTQTFTSVGSAITLGSNRVAVSARTAANGHEVFVVDDTKVSMVSEPLAPGFASGAMSGADLWAIEGSLYFGGYDRLGVGAEIFRWAAGGLSQPYGAAGPRQYDFRASDPHVGKNLSLLTSADASAVAVLHTLSTPALFPMKLGGSRFYLNLSNLILLVSTLNQGKAVTTIPVPNMPRFIGMQLEGQAIVVDIKLAMHLTQAVNLSIGK